MKLVYSIVLALGACWSYAQEFQATVKVLSPNIQATNKQVFTTLETNLQNFVNNTKWTDENYDNQERIQASFVFNIRSYDINANSMAGTLQIQYSRPVYNSDYQSPILSFIDNDVAFFYVENSPIEFSPTTNLSNLSSIMAFYCYIIIGMDHDSYGFGSGEPFYLKAQNVVSNAQSDNSASGWRSFDGNKNRYWMVDNLLNPGFQPIVSILYEYHRKGLDLMYDPSKQVSAKENIKKTLMQLEEIHKKRPGSFLMQLFMDAKYQEIISIFNGGPNVNCTDLIRVLQLVDGARASNYDNLGRS